jgi:ATP-binding cassette subfamily F protein 3
MLVNELKPDKGEARFGAGTKVGYFPQDIAFLNLKRTALEEVMESGANQETAHTVLGTLLLPKRFADKKLSELSTGERSKVLLARILAGGANLLILDEPTNHLDIDTLLAMENLLTAAPVGVLFASHDRALISKLADRVLEIKSGTLVDHRERYEALFRKS